MFAAQVAATGLEPQAIDGAALTASIADAANDFTAAFMCEALGLSPTWLNSGNLGGASAICVGRCGMAVVLLADATIRQPSCLQSAR